MLVHLNMGSLQVLAYANMSQLWYIVLILLTLVINRLSNLYATGTTTVCDDTAVINYANRHDMQARTTFHSGHPD